MNHHSNRRDGFVQEESGATAIEYALIASMVAIIAISAMTAFGTNATNMWNLLTTTITAAL